jgi:replicative DNA helicase
LSPWDDIIYKQLIDYEVEKTTASGVPVFTSKDEHFIDALGLAYLAMVLEFKKLTGVMQDFETATKIDILSNTHLINPAAFQTQNLRDNTPQEVKDFYANTDFSEIRGERQSWVKLNSYQGPMNPTHKYDSSGTAMGRSYGKWGSRSGGGFSRKGW